MKRQEIIDKIMNMDAALGRSLEDVELVPDGQVKTLVESFERGYIRGIAWALYCMNVLTFEEKEILNGNAEEA